MLHNIKIKSQNGVHSQKFIFNKKSEQVYLSPLNMILHVVQ